MKRTLFIFAKVCLLSLLMASFSVWAQTPQNKPITQEQADAILKELHQIRELLGKTGRASAPPAQGSADENQTLKVNLEGAFALGREDAPVTLVEFLDFQCPYCRQFHSRTFEDLRKNYIDTGKLRFVAMDLPLSFHEHAATAAQAALCAGEQSKFWEMRDLLLRQSDLSDDNIEADAKQLQLNSESFQTCLKGGKYTARLQSELAQADALGLRGTPSFILGRTSGTSTLTGTRLVGALPYDSLAAKIQGLLTETSAQGQLQPAAKEAQALEQTGALR